MENTDEPPGPSSEWADHRGSTDRVTKAGAAVKPYRRLVFAIDREDHDAGRVTVECGEAKCQEGPPKTSPPCHRDESEVDEFDGVTVGAAIEEEHAGRDAVDSEDVPPVGFSSTGCEVSGEDVGGSSEARESGAIQRVLVGLVKQFDQLRLVAVPGRDQDVGGQFRDGIVPKRGTGRSR